LRSLLKWTGIGLAAVLVIAISLPFFINVNQFRPALETDLSSALGRQVELGNLHLNIFKGEVTADDLSVAEDPAFGKPAFLQAKSLHVGVKLWPFLISRQLIVTNLDLDQPEIVLAQSPTGSWNFSSLGGKSSSAPAPAAGAGGRMPLNLSVKLVKISGGRLTLRRTVGHWKPLVLENAAVELRDFSAASVFPFSLSTKVRGGGSIQFDGKAGPINPADSSMTPVSFNVNVTGLDLAGSGMNDFAPDVSGVAAVKASGTSDGTKLQMNGTFQAEHVKLAKNGNPANRPIELDFSMNHDLRAHSGTLLRGDVHLGKALAHLTGTYAEKGEAMVLALKLDAPGMPVPELEAFLPALGVALPAGASLQGGTATAELTMTGPADRLVSSGSLSVDNTRLAGFDLPGKMSSIEKLAGMKTGPDTEIRTLSADVKSAPEGTAIQNLKLMIPSIGEMTGGGTVSPANQLDFKMTAAVQTSGAMAVMRDKPIPFLVEGTFSQPVFKPDLKAVAGEELKSVEGDVGKAAGGLIKGFLGDRKKK
jgi:AsmA protein